MYSRYGDACRLTSPRRSIPCDIHRSLMSQPSSTATGGQSSALSRQAQYMILAAAFSGWMFAGGQMAITALASRSATADMLFPTAARVKLDDEQDKIAGQWYARHQ